MSKLRHTQLSGPNPRKENNPVTLSPEFSQSPRVRSLAEWPRCAQTQELTPAFQKGVSQIAAIKERLVLADPPLPRVFSGMEVLCCLFFARETGYMLYTPHTLGGCRIPGHARLITKATGLTPKLLPTRLGCCLQVTYKAPQVESTLF